MTPQPVPLKQTATTAANSIFKPVPVDAGILEIPDPPASGTVVLTSTNGVLSWETAA